MLLPVEKKAKSFIKKNSKKTSTDKTLQELKKFRKKYPFTEDLQTIEKLKPDEIYKEQISQIGEFFQYAYFKNIDQKVYLKILTNFETFKSLLYIVADKNKSLAEKMDAPWDEISRLGGDSQAAKKIIYAFNYETGQAIPVSNKNHIEYFLRKINQEFSYPTHYESMSLGEKYEALAKQLLESKESSLITKPWDITVFCKFLYKTYPPPKAVADKKIKKKQKEEKVKLQEQFAKFMDLLVDLKKHSKISPEELRAYRKKWDENPKERVTLTKTLSARSFKYRPRRK
jgi:hypothetical protein